MYVCMYVIVTITNALKHELFYRLVRFNKRFRAIFNTLAVLLPRIISIIILLLIIFYFFAIIGMESFEGKVYKGCCKLVTMRWTCNVNCKFLWSSGTDMDIGRYYSGIGSNVYYLNNFNNLPRSFGKPSKVYKQYIRT